jgi:hypothetical protein
MVGVILHLPIIPLTQVKAGSISSLWYESKRLYQLKLEIDVIPVKESHIG